VAESFIDVAEETGLLRPIDEWMLVQAIEQATTWRSELSASDFADVAINVTARHLADAHFAPSVIDALAARGVPTSMLQIEVTERVLMEASNSAITALTTLRDAGVKVGLDDFGTGYSSLSYLRLFPLDFVKIDGSFVRELHTAGSERAIVASIVDLSHALGMTVVAEGVETVAQLEHLVELGCDRAQGYLIAAAGPPDDVADRVLRPSSARHEARVQGERVTAPSRVAFGVAPDLGGAFPM
jgi:EAL domain-containing protein (putative c-di-GMP-specific phosphodiesterase class I)